MRENKQPSQKSGKNNSSKFLSSIKWDPLLQVLWVWPCAETSIPGQVREDTNRLGWSNNVLILLDEITLETTFQF